jgi:hypothetical protein
MVFSLCRRWQRARTGALTNEIKGLSNFELLGTGLNAQQMVTNAQRMGANTQRMTTNRRGMSLNRSASPPVTGARAGHSAVDRIPPRLDTPALSRRTGPAVLGGKP